jgi:hypothetical protein
MKNSCLIRYRLYIIILIESYVQHLTPLGEATIQKNATALKYREMPKGQQATSA